jgi:hypothetical protein
MCTSSQPETDHTTASKVRTTSTKSSPPHHHHYQKKNRQANRKTNREYDEEGMLRKLW